MINPTLLNNLNLEVVNKLFIELSQITTAKTQKELFLENEVKQLYAQIKRLERRTEEEGKEFRR